MEKVLGLDLGTNSIGWAIVNRVDSLHCELIDKGTHIFKEGVAREKGVETPMVKQRTQARASRRHYFRRRLRKIELLKVLVENGFCPYIDTAVLDEWKSRKKYPLIDEFIAWQRTDDTQGKNPYYDRYRCLSERLDFSKLEDRYVFGRAMYHLAQRRGFLSNRKDQSNSSEDGVVKEGISGLNSAMQVAGCKYLGEYFYKIYGSKNIRRNYTSRIEHYLSEFDEICRIQNIGEELKSQLYRAIFYQRPLKSQKGLVGKCTFEKDKPRCPVSHPLFEEFRMWSFVNNIRIKVLDEASRPLNQEELSCILPLFYRKSKSEFSFEDIAKVLAKQYGGKTCKYAYNDEYPEFQLHFNYRLSTPVSGCPVTASLQEIFGKDYITAISEVYIKGEGKTAEQILDDVWHVLFNFNDDEKLRMWAELNLQLSKEESDKFVKIKIPQGYAALSLKAIRKILVYLRQGMRYDEAVFLANVQMILPQHIWENAERRQLSIDKIVAALQDYKYDPLFKTRTKDVVVKDCLIEDGASAISLSKLYHPSMIESYPAVLPDKDGIYQLGSPRIASVRNPMAMRALFQLRHLINQLLREGAIDRDTKINIEFSRMLNDSNRRKAIERYQREQKKKHDDYYKELKEYFSNDNTYEPTENDILKYQLWKEQKETCLYTGKTIRISDFIGTNPVFDIEHTVPRSRGGDDSQMNKTLCECRFNREIKGSKLPSQLAEWEDIMSRIAVLGWESRLDDLYKQKARTKGYSATKDEKDRNIQNRHYIDMQIEYLKGKLERFRIKEVDAGFTNRQGVDIGIIGRYARLYLKSIFPRIYVVKGATTADFRQAWGLQEPYSKKERVNHVHHCIDAITIACIGKSQYDEWAHYCAAREQYDFGRANKPTFEKPWPTFTEDINKISDELLISNQLQDNIRKRTKKALRIRGKIQRNEAGEIMYQTGDSARMSLHLETFYGAIEKDGEIKYVVRKPLPNLDAGDVKKIVDDVVRQKVEQAIEKYGSLKEAVSQGIWMNEDKRIPINKVRIYVPSVTNPLHLKKQRDCSCKEYKQSYHVANEVNYCIALYEDIRGKRAFELINPLSAVSSMKQSGGNIVACQLDGKELKCVLKVGQKVLFYEETPEEIYEADVAELSRRLYVVNGMSILNVGNNSYGRIVLRYHQEARPEADCKAVDGKWSHGEKHRPFARMLHTQFNALVEGYDFDMTVTGKIIFKHR